MCDPVAVSSRNTPPQNETQVGVFVQSKLYSASKEPPDGFGIRPEHVSRHQKGGWCVARYFNDLRRELPPAMEGVSLDSILRDQLKSLARLDENEVIIA